MTEKELNTRWENTANKILLGRKIVSIKWMGEEEADENFGWNKRPVKLMLDDGTILIPQCDDEGNDGGVLLWLNPKELVESKHFPGEKFTKSEVLPVF
tara:strand:- start:17227 stop:17520 length:294 start_codon:yes stop_codon:yes gene_type:complete